MVCGEVCESMGFFCGQVQYVLKFYQIENFNVIY